MSNETKICPYCGEEILSVAKKCRHCGEWLKKENIKTEFNWAACTLTWIWGIWHGIYKSLWCLFFKITFLLLFLLIYSLNIFEALLPYNHVVNARVQLFIFIICSIFVNGGFSYHFGFKGNKWINQNSKNIQKSWIKLCVIALVIILSIILEITFLFFILHDLLLFSFWYD